jgi:hypothetical protein
MDVPRRAIQFVTSPRGPEQASRRRRRRKICVIAINHHNFGGLGANWWMARGHIHERLGRGRRHPFALGIGSYVAAVKASITGRPIPARPTPAEAADGWETAAFVEAVKCAPWEKVSEPTAAMWRNCPPRFLVPELELLAPRVVIVAGRGPGQGVIADALAVDTRRAHGQSFERCRGRLEGQPIDVLFCNHPGRPVNFTPSYRALHESPHQPAAAIPAATYACSASGLMTSEPWICEKTHSFCLSPDAFPSQLPPRSERPEARHLERKHRRRDLTGGRIGDRRRGPFEH